VFQRAIYLVQLNAKILSSVLLEDGWSESRIWWDS